MTELSHRDAKLLAGVLLHHWWVILSLALVGAISGYAIASAMTRIYAAQATVLSVEEQPTAGLGALASQLGAIASLGGFNLQGGGSDKTEAIQVLRSQSLIRAFIQEERLLPILFWKKWDEKRSQWRSDEKRSPSLADGVKIFQEKICRVKEDKSTGLITVTVRWRDREVAARWANEIVRRADETARARALERAKSSLAYLDRELERTTLLEAREAIFRLEESQLKIMMLANVGREYAFKVIDPAIAPDEDDIASPQRAILTGVGLICGAFFGVILAILWRGGARGSFPRAPEAIKPIRSLDD